MNTLYLKAKWFLYFSSLLIISFIFMVKVMANSDKAYLVTLAQEGNLSELKRQIEQGADVNARDAIQDSPYLYSGARGLQEILELTLSHGSSLKSVNRYGGTALIPASERGHVKTVKTLIDAGVDVDHINRLGWTALIEAIILGDGSQKYEDIVTLLIEGGANVNLADASGQTPLTLAKDKGYTNIVNILKQAGAE
ncbi:ankyrin repeat domain-containing protein [Proteus faecis]|uniref:ankyrin repeat domain-containing protein n=1 Tax=Proteus faecis TaxID=2050967 RepID=UPI003075D429